ncbi:PAS domain S-box protein, partial [bacterium]|nr:PAS domain S-box protein [candidate division CSSED10-310 bacterium]
KVIVREHVLPLENNRPIQVTTIPFQNEDGEWLLAEVNVDISERKKMEVAIQESEQKYRTVVENSSEGICILQNFQIVFVNNTFCAITGYRHNALRGKSFCDLIHPENIERFRSGLLHLDDINNHKTGFEIQMIRKDSEKIITEMNIGRINLDGVLSELVFIKDITVKRRMEEDILNAHKLDSIAMLAGGIAHDFNNILTAILGNISIAKHYIKMDEKVYKILDRAEEASMRAKGLTHQLLTFSKGGTPVKKVVSPESVIRDTVRFALQGSNIKCQHQIGKNLWPVEIDPIQITQVINNLVLNAVQSMPEGGNIHLKIKNKQINQNSGIPLTPGKYIEVIVQDYGIGISKENLKRVFDPYFTTKTKGNGLGLSISYSIIRRHDGYINIESEEGKGTRCRFYLPASSKPIDRDESEDRSFFKGHGRVLVMDDDVMVQQVASSMLNELGFQVDIAADGLQAIEKYKQKMKMKTPYDCVIIDLTIPGGMGGAEAMKHLLKIDPKVTALVSSGYSNDPILSNYQEYGFKAYLSKPFDINDMRSILEKIITSD